MIEMVKVFPDQLKERSKIISELKEWQENGIKLMGKYVEPELLNIFFHEISNLSTIVSKWKNLNEKEFMSLYQKFSS